MPGDNQMAGSLNAGSIIYEVDMDTAKLLAARREVDAALNGMGANMGRLEASVTRTERSVSSMGQAMSSLSGIAKGVAAALSIQQVAEYGNEWVNVNNKLANSVRANEQLADVTQRVFDISQNTMSSLSATATLYGRLERATRSAGTSTKDLVTLTTTINKGLAVSGATTEEASSTMTQLSQALASGVLRGEEFNSISENGSRLAVALADSLGVTIGQLRGMAAQGQLTTEVVVNGLLKQSDVIAKEFGNTVTTMGQAFTTATNNITKFVGESSSVQSTINVFNKSVISLSENLDVIGTAVAVLATVMGSRFVGMLSAATAAKIKLAYSAREAALADNQAAQAAANLAAAELRSSLAAKQRAIDEIRLAEMMRASAFSAANTTAAEASLSAARVSAATATDNYNRALAANATAQAAANTAARNANAGIGLFRSALSLVGGPVGVAALAASAVLYFSNAAKEARKESNELADGVNNLVQKFKAMSDVEVASSVAKLSKNIPQLNDSLEEAQEAFDKTATRVVNLKKEVENWGEGIKRGRQAAEALSGAQDDMAIAADNLAQAQRRLDQTQSAINLGRATLNGTLKDGIDLLKRDGEQASIAAGMMNQFGKALDIASKAKERFNSSSLEIPRSQKADEYNQSLEEENELLSITDKRLRAVTKAKMEAQSKQGNQNQINSAGELAGKQYDLQQAEAARNKAAKDANSESKKAANQAESVAQKLAKLKEQSELAAESTQELTREKAILNAQQSLGKGATDNDIRQAGEYAAKTFDSAKAVRDLAQAEQGRKFATQEIAAANVMPDAVTGAVVDPTAQIDLQEQQKLAALAKYQAIDTENTQIYEDAKTAIQRQASNARQQIIQDEADMQSAAISSIIGSVAQGFDGLANLAAGAAGRSSGAYQAMFALSKGFAVAQSALNLQLAISQAMADPTALTPAQKLANYASIASAGAGVLSTIGSISYGGGREHGGPVNGNSMYRVGEGGKPEIYKASNGNQYMIPGDNGRVISNSDIGRTDGGASFNPTMNLTINTTGGIDDGTVKQLRQAWSTDMMMIMRDQQRPGGMLRKK
jgi:tape measure domain-containing protein